MQDMSENNRSETDRLRAALTTLQADHARVLGLVRTACERWRAQTNAQEGISFRMAMKELEASLPAQPAQGGVKCVWVDDEGGIYQTGCKHAFMVDPDSDEPPIWIKFCCYCGSLVEFFVPAAEGETRA